MLFRSTKKNLHHDLIVNSFQLEVRFMMRITRCPRLATDQFDLIHDCNSTFILLTDFDQRALVLPKQTPILQKVKWIYSGVNPENGLSVLVCSSLDCLETNFSRTNGSSFFVSLFISWWIWFESKKKGVKIDSNQINFFFLIFRFVIRFFSWIYCHYLRFGRLSIFIKKNSRIQILF